MYLRTDSSDAGIDPQPSSEDSCFPNTSLFSSDDPAKSVLLPMYLFRITK